MNKELYCNRSNMDFILGTLNDKYAVDDTSDFVDITKSMPSTVKYLQSCVGYASCQCDDELNRHYAIGDFKWVLTADDRTLAKPNANYKAMKAEHNYDGKEYMRLTLLHEYSSDSGCILALCDKEYAVEVSYAARTLKTYGKQLYVQGGCAYCAGADGRFAALFVSDDYGRENTGKRVFVYATDDTFCLFKAIGSGSWLLMFKTDGELPKEFSVDDTLFKRGIHAPKSIIPEGVPYNKVHYRDTLQSCGAKFYSILSEAAPNVVMDTWRNAIC